MNIEIGANNPILRKKSVPIDKITPEIKTFAKQLKKDMYQYDGVGLAAPQVGKNIQIIAITTRQKKNKKIIKKGDMILINPTIITHSSHTSIDIEGCISLPGIEGNVERYTSITVQYTSLKEKTMTQTFDGFTASVIQHEIDHLEGILFIDKIIR